MGGMEDRVDLEHKEVLRVWLGALQSGCAAYELTFRW
jgi:hypothetical protein